MSKERIVIDTSEEDLKGKIAETLLRIMLVRTQERADEVAQLIIDDLIGREYTGGVTMDNTPDPESEMERVRRAAHDFVEARDSHDFLKMAKADEEMKRRR